VKKADSIFYVATIIILMMISFFCGSIMEQNTHIEGVDLLLNQKDSIQGVADGYENNADYNALFNMESKNITDGCRRCAPGLSAIQFKLDSIETYKDTLVVSSIAQPK
jgi:hypothetical protein